MGLEAVGAVMTPGTGAGNFNAMLLEDLKALAGGFVPNTAREVAFVAGVMADWCTTPVTNPHTCGS